MLKKIYILLFILIVFNYSCTKDQNRITGKITYKDPLTGKIYNASNGEVSLMSMDDKLGKSFSAKVICALDGSFVINQVDDGEWYLYSTYKSDTLEYKGKSDLFKLKGKTEVIRDLTLNR